MKKKSLSQLSLNDWTLIDSTFITLSFIGSKSTKNGYPMRQMGRSYPDYEELKRDAPGAGLRKFFLAVYILVGSLITAALIAMAVLAPTRDFLVEFNILPETESY